MDQLRLQKIEKIINSYDGCIKVVITKPNELIEDVNWLIGTIRQLKKYIDKTNYDSEQIAIQNVQLKQKIEQQQEKLNLINEGYDSVEVHIDWYTELMKNREQLQEKDKELEQLKASITAIEFIGGVEMKKGIIVKCIEDVVMREESELDAGKRMFTVGKYYRTYPYDLPKDYSFERVICAKNDMGERHIIKHLDNELDEFFNKHFEVIEIQ